MVNYFTFADTMAAKSLTTRTRCQRSQRLRGHDKGLADTRKSTRTLSENCKGFSQLLKEQSDEKGTWVCYKPNSNNIKFKN